MTITYETMRNLTSIILFILLIPISLTPLALADPIESDIYDQWNTIEEFEEVSSLRKFLLDRDWISKEVSLDELDYILVLTQQCSSEFFPAVPTSLVLSIISIESGFQKDLVGFNNDIGLMQVIPKFHQALIEEYMYEENVDLYDPRLNIMVGMGYLDELLNWSRGDIERTIMAYNMGQLKADRFASSGYVTQYAKEVIGRMNEIELFFERGCRSCLS